MEVFIPPLSSDSDSDSPTVTILTSTSQAPIVVPPHKKRPNKRHATAFEGEAPGTLTGWTPRVS